MITLGLVLLGVALLMVAGIVTMNFGLSITGLINSNSTIAITDDEGIIANPTIDAAQPGTLTVRTSDVAGTLTMTNTDHGIVTGQRIDLYWDDGQCYGATVGTVAGLSVPFATVEGGTVLPIATTAMIAGIPEVVPLLVTGNNVTALALTAAQSGWFVFADGTGDIYAKYVAANAALTWKTGDVGASPLAGLTPTLLYISHKYVTAEVTGMRAAMTIH